jgi:hypothetical protein
MPREEDFDLSDLNVPWVTKDGFLDLTKFPMDATLAQAVGDDMEGFRSACRLLGSMASAGRTPASVFLYGLLAFCRDDLTRKEPVIEALRYVRTRQAAQLLFEELNRTESSNTTRGYINAVLKALEGFPLECVEDGFERLLSDPKWSYKMKRKFSEILEEIIYRNER